MDGVSPSNKDVSNVDKLEEHVKLNNEAQMAIRKLMEISERKKNGEAVNVCEDTKFVDEIDGETAKHVLRYLALNDYIVEHIG